MIANQNKEAVTIRWNEVGSIAIGHSANHMVIVSAKSADPSRDRRHDIVLFEQGCDEPIETQLAGNYEEAKSQAEGMLRNPYFINDIPTSARRPEGALPSIVELYQYTWAEQDGGGKNLQREYEVTPNDLYHTVGNEWLENLRESWSIDVRDNKVIVSVVPGTRDD